MSDYLSSVILSGLCLVLVGLSACQSNLAAPTPVHTPTPIPSPLERNFVLYMDAPLLPLGPSGSWDSGLMDPGAVVYHDGKFHMLYNAVPQFPALLSVGYAESTDGITWTRVITQPVFTCDDVPWDPKPGNIRINSVLVEDDTWVLYFSASNALSKLIGVVGRATAPAPTGPWRVDAEPILEPGVFGEWDAGAIGHVDVLRTAAGYVMYYSCAKGIGMATSPDGRQWTKYNDPATTEAAFANSDPVLSKSDVEDPNVQRTAWGWAMVYRHANRLNYVYSWNGVQWIEPPQSPIVALPGSDVWYAAFVIHQDTAYLYFESGRATTRSYLATWEEASPQ